MKLPKEQCGYSEKKHAAIMLVIGLLAGAAAFFAVATTSGGVGWTWDEVYYFSSSELQIEWFKAIIPAIKQGELSHVFSKDILDSYWLWDTYHNPHPPFYKILSSLSLMAFKNALGEFVAYRLATALLAGMLVCFLFLAVEKKHGLLPALYGALSLLLMPLFFGHAHIAATEIPLAAFWFCSYWAFWKGLDRLSGSLLLAVFLGCALATKFTAVLIPCAFLLWSILYRDKRALRNIAAMALSPVIAVMLNPGWWHQPFKKLFDFILISISREATIPISTFFMNKMYVFSPPWYYSPVMIAITVPAIILLTILLGLVFLVKYKFRSAYDMLFILNIPCIFAVVMLPNAPVHDGIRQFFSLLPFLAYLSAMGFCYFSEFIAAVPMKAYLRQSILFFCLLCFSLYGGYQLKKYHPYELSYYNELIGGLRGAYERGMEITYWFDVITPEFMEFLNKKTPDGAQINIWPPNSEYFSFLQAKGKIKQNLKFYPLNIQYLLEKKQAQPESPAYIILMSRLSTFVPVYRDILKKCTPVFSLTLEGVPLVSLYRW